MAARTHGTQSPFHSTHPALASAVRGVGALGFAIALGLAAAPAGAVGQLGSIDLVSRPEGRVLPVYAKDGRHWVVG